MHQSWFFKLFPPPKYMAMRFAGLEISDDAIRCIQYSPSVRGLEISKYASVELPRDTVRGGDVNNEQVLRDALKVFVAKNKLSYVCVSVPEEKAYLFQTDVVGDTITGIAQNIESKLEENVPISAKDAIFYFDILPLEITGGVLRASVSVVPSVYIEKQVSLLQGAGLSPVAFEVTPKSIARAVLTNDPNKTSMVVHIMNEKAGIYIVCGGVVCFTTTCEISQLRERIDHTFTFWKSKSPAVINELVLTGSKAPIYLAQTTNFVTEYRYNVVIANTWANILNTDSYIPPIEKAESSDYAVVAGLALDQ